MTQLIQVCFGCILGIWTFVSETENKLLEVILYLKMTELKIKIIDLSQYMQKKYLTKFNRIQNSSKEIESLLQHKKKNII